MKKKALEKRNADLENSNDSLRERLTVANQTLAVMRQALGPEPMSMTTSAIYEEPETVELATGTWQPRKRPPYLWGTLQARREARFGPPNLIHEDAG